MSKEISSSCEPLSHPIFCSLRRFRRWSAERTLQSCSVQLVMLCVKPAEQQRAQGLALVCPTGKFRGIEVCIVAWNGEISIYLRENNFKRAAPRRKWKNPYSSGRNFKPYCVSSKSLDTKARCVLAGGYLQSFHYTLFRYKQIFFYVITWRSITEEAGHDIVTCFQD